MTKRLCLFAHFDAQGELKPFIVHYLRKLREECDDIFFISVSNPGPNELCKLDGIASRRLMRENVGYDFAMWQQALGQIDLDLYDELLLTNSSIFGPLWPLSDVFARMAKVDCDIWGMTDNIEIGWHLQSYFLLFRRRALQSEAFKKFWSAVLPFRDKNQVIRSYEVGLSVYFKEQGFMLESVAKIDELLRRKLLHRIKRPRHRLNPTCAQPLELIKDRLPLVKVELFRDNPLEVDLRPVRRAIAQAGYDMNLLVYDRPRRPQATRHDSA